MAKAEIHPLAVVEEGATIGEGVIIEPFAVVKKDVILEEGVIIKSHAYIDGFTRIGKGTIIWPKATIGTKTQDLKYRGEKTYVEIGKQCEIREFATINSSTSEGTVVRIGDHSLIMACCHVAHNCELGKHVIMSNNALLAGHVIVEDYAIIGGMTAVHQFSRIGAHAMVGGMSRITHDVPPYTIGGGIPYHLGGINRIGLKRRLFSFEKRQALAKAFRLLYRSNLTLASAMMRIEDEVEGYPEIEHLIAFCRASKRGLIGMYGHRRAAENEEKNGSDLLVEISERI